jgi:outer membrane immunogenic protein
MKARLLAAAIVIGSTAGALAADPSLPIEDVPVGFNWTGGYIGGQVGYAWGDSHYYVVDTDTVTGRPDPDGFLGGVYVGYNYQLQNNVVLGVDADFAWASVDGTDDEVIETISGDLNWSGAVRARLGYAVDRFLPYIAGGVAFADYDHRLMEEAEVGDTYVGWTLGVGAEYAFTDNLVGRAEYRYTDFGTEEFPLDNGISAHEVDLKTNEIRFGIAYKF